MPKEITGNQIFFIESFIDFYHFCIASFLDGSRIPWSNRAEVAVRLDKRAWIRMPKALIGENYVDHITVRQAMKKKVWTRNYQFIISDSFALEIIMR